MGGEDSGRNPCFLKEWMEVGWKIEDSLGWLGMLSKDLFLFWFPWYRISKVLESKRSSSYFSWPGGEREELLLLCAVPQKCMVWSRGARSPLLCFLSCTEGAHFPLPSSCCCFFSSWPYKINFPSSTLHQPKVQKT